MLVAKNIVRPCGCSFFGSVKLKKRWKIWGSFETTGFTTQIYVYIYMHIIVIQE